MKQKITFNNKAVYSLIVIGILILFASADFCSAVTNFRTVKDADSVRPKTLTSSVASDERSVAAGESSRSKTLTSSKSISNYQHSTGTGLQSIQTEASDADIMNAAGESGDGELYMAFLNVFLDFPTDVNAPVDNTKSETTPLQSYSDYFIEGWTMPTLPEDAVDQVFNGIFGDIEPNTEIVKYEYTKPSYPTIEEWYTDLLTSEYRPKGWTGGVQPMDTGTATPEEQYLYSTTEGTTGNLDTSGMASRPITSLNDYTTTWDAGNLAWAGTPVMEDTWGDDSGTPVMKDPWWKGSDTPFMNDVFYSTTEGTTGNVDTSGMASTQTVTWSDLINVAWATGDLEKMDNILNQMFAEEDLSEFFASKKPSAFRIL